MSRTELGLPAEQRTIVTDHSIEPIPGMGVCDFCTSTPVVAAYPCGVIILETPLGRHGSNDAWGACDHCYALIEADDRNGLVERALGGFIAQEGEMPEAMCRVIREGMRDLQAAFFIARQGDAELLP